MSALAVISDMRHEKVWIINNVDVWKQVTLNLTNSAALVLALYNVTYSYIYTYIFFIVPHLLMAVNVMVSQAIFNLLHMSSILASTAI